MANEILPPKDRPPRDTGRPPLFRLALRFAVGLIYICFLAAVVDMGTSYSFWHALAMIFVAACTLLVIVLVLAVRAATAQAGRAWQVNVSTLLLITACAAIYFGLMQWLLRGSGVDPTGLSVWNWVNLFIGSGIILVLSIPYLFFLIEGLVWLAAWLVRRRTTQRLIRLFAWRR